MEGVEAPYFAASGFPDAVEDENVIEEPER